VILMPPICYIKYTGQYTLDNTLYIVDKRICKVYLPPVLMDGFKYYWIQWQDDLDVTIVENKDLKLLNRNGRLLYGKKTKV